MQAFYAHKIDDEILGREQHRISSELRRERRKLDALSSRLGFAVERIDRAVDVLVQANDRYADLSPMNRRRLARALFAGIYVRDRQIERFELVHGLSLIRRTADALAGGSNMNCLVELIGHYSNR